MSKPVPPDFGVNSWLEDELYQKSLHDRKTVDESWKKVFESNGAAAPAAPAAASARAPQPASGEQLIPLRGAAARIAENMTASLTIPLATSQRVIPVKVIDENRRIINEHRTLIGRPKISYTHIIGWAIVQALPTNPALNYAYSEVNGEPMRVMRSQVNIGIAVDVAGKDGVRSLKVPNIKNAGTLNFAQSVAAVDDIVAR